MKILKTLKNLLFPEYKSDFWYNYAAHSRDVNYSVFDEDGKYIDCCVGLDIEFEEDDKTKVFRVTNVWRDRPGSDWLYSSDCIQCDLKRIA